MVRRGAAVAVTALVLAAGGQATAYAADAPALTCAAAYQTADARSACEKISGSIDAIQRALLPRERAALVNALAVGVPTNGTVLQCELGTSCDVAAAALAGLDLSTDGEDDDLAPGTIAVVNAALSDVTDAVAAAAQTLVNEALVAVERASGSDTAAAVNALITKIKDVAGDRSLPENVVRTALGAVVTAALVAPYVGTPNGPHRTTSVGLVMDPRVPVLDGANEGFSCEATFQYVQWLTVHKATFSGNMSLESGFKIYKLKFKDYESNGVCAEAKIDVEGSLIAASTSNAGSFIASRTKYGPLQPGGGTLTSSDPGYVYGPGQLWQTDAIEVDYDFPYGIEMHYFGPPAGNQQWDGNLHLYVHPPYQFAGSGQQEARVVGLCRKIGTAESACSNWRTS